LTLDQINTELADAGAELAGLRAAIAADPVLAELLTTPLMFGIAVIAWREGGDHAPATSGPDVGQYRRMLYDRYLDRLLDRDRVPRSGRHPAGTGRRVTAGSYRYLVWLARLMTRRGETIFYPDWFTPAWLPGAHPPWPLPDRWADGLTSRRGLRRTAVAVTYGIAGGLITGVVYGLQAWLSGARPVRDEVLDVPPGYAVLVAVTVCLAVALTCLLTGTTGDSPGAGRGGWRGYAVRGVVYGAVFFAAGGLHKGLITGREHEWAHGVAAGLSGGLLYGSTSAASLLWR
jgi:hypothetical protein